MLARDATLFDPGALDDPLVGRVDHALQVGIGQNFFRKKFSGAGDGHRAKLLGTHERA